jgi:hypothetical protein
MRIEIKDHDCTLLTTDGKPLSLRAHSVNDHRKVISWKPFAQFLRIHRKQVNLATSRTYNKVAFAYDSEVVNLSRHAMQIYHRRVQD